LQEVGDGAGEIAPNPTISFEESIPRILAPDSNLERLALVGNCFEDAHPSLKGLRRELAGRHRSLSRLTLLVPSRPVAAVM
jgi:hypothetical protein